jgi:calcineurin-like phosphoesterase family protein
MKNLPVTWIIGDTHLYHDNIVKYCNRPEDHTEILIKNLQDMIHEDDTLIHLGDVIFYKGCILLRDILEKVAGKKNPD